MHQDGFHISGVNDLAALRPAVRGLPAGAATAWRTGRSCLIRSNVLDDVPLPRAARCVPLPSWRPGRCRRGHGACGEELTGAGWPRRRLLSPSSGRR
jgi:hypothetical protein